jgi:hypothetical protein
MEEPKLDDLLTNRVHLPSFNLSRFREFLAVVELSVENLEFYEAVQRYRIIYDMFMESKRTSINCSNDPDICLVPVSISPSIQISAKSLDHARPHDSAGSNPLPLPQTSATNIQKTVFKSRQSPKMSEQTSVASVHRPSGEPNFAIILENQPMRGQFASSLVEVSPPKGNQTSSSPSLLLNSATARIRDNVRHLAHFRAFKKGSALTKEVKQATSADKTTSTNALLAAPLNEIDGDFYSRERRLQVLIKLVSGVKIGLKEIDVGSCDLQSSKKATRIISSMFASVDPTAADLIFPAAASQAISVASHSGGNPQKRNSGSYQENPLYKTSFKTKSTADSIPLEASDFARMFSSLNIIEIEAYIIVFQFLVPGAANEISAEETLRHQIYNQLQCDQNFHPTIFSPAIGFVLQTMRHQSFPKYLSDTVKELWSEMIRFKDLRADKKGTSASANSSSSTLQKLSGGQLHQAV